MVREDILGGLKNALTRGQTLMQAMMSFYNAGYMREEIEEAARYLQLEKSQPIQNQFASGPTAPIFQRNSVAKKDLNEEPKEKLSQTAKPVEQTQTTESQTIQKASAYGQQPTQPAQVQPVQKLVQPVQKASAYGQQPTQPAQPAQVQQLKTVKPKGKGIIFILLALLILLIGGLIAVFFFKDELLSFFN